MPTGGVRGKNPFRKARWNVMDVFNGRPDDFEISPVVATGGTVTDITQDGINYRVHTFTSNGTFEVTLGGEVEYLVVGGGGGGGAGIFSPWGVGGGGAGGFVENIFKVIPNTFSVVVGDGGATQTSEGQKGNPGSNSSVFGVIALGGGGGQGNWSFNNRDDGGSGGGGATSGGAGLQPGSASSGFGNNGGLAFNDNPFNGGGGGGANAAGQNATSTKGGDGGAGRPSSITGTSVTYAGGGGGGSNGSAGGGGGSGGGGAGNNSSGNGFPGTANTGGGGGGSGPTPINGGAGGSGIVIVRYRIG